MSEFEFLSESPWHLANPKTEVLTFPRQSWDLRFETRAARREHFTSVPSSARLCSFSFSLRTWSLLLKEGGRERDFFEMDWAAFWALQFLEFPRQPVGGIRGVNVHSAREDTVAQGNSPWQTAGPGSVPDPSYSIQKLCLYCPGPGSSLSSSAGGCSGASYSQGAGLPPCPCSCEICFSCWGV